MHIQFSKQHDLKSNESLDKEFGDSVKHWPAFLDSADALRILKKKV